MQRSKSVRCPQTGFKKSCEEVRRKCHCPKWVKLEGANPQTGERVDQEHCVDTWMPVLVVENSKRLYEVAGALTSYRNELHRLGRAVIGGAEHHTKTVGDALAMILQKTATTEKLMTEAVFGSKLTAKVADIVRAELAFTDNDDDVKQIDEGDDHDGDQSRE